MIAYDPLVHESFVIAWWANLESDKELVFHSSVHRLGPFLNLFKPPTSLLFDYDQDGIWFAAWTGPLYDGAEFGMWIRPTHRKTREAWKALQLAYNVALKKYPVLVGFTKQSELHAGHLKLGYAYAGRIRGIMDGADVYAYELSREGWANRKAAARQVREAKRERRANLSGGRVVEHLGDRQQNQGGNQLRNGNGDRTATDGGG